MSARRRESGRRSFFTVLIALAAGVAGCGDADGDMTPHGEPLVVRDAWARPADSGATGGAYFSVMNRDTMARAITGLATTDARSAELHETMEHDGMSHMTARPSMAIPRDSTLVMAPGGLHVMLHALTRTLRAGDTVRLSLTLDDGRQVPVAIPVRTP